MKETPIIFNPIEHPIIFLHPERLVEPGAWVEHIPFAFFLISITKPDLIVELGTHSGNSYCAFCQAVAKLNLPSKCYAIDTWEGDEQAGLYGREVLSDLKSFHDNRFSSFSTLLKSTFDEALPNFSDHSIDLLHIDGEHTYAAVRHDFDEWYPKLSAKSIVIFHDISVRTKNFGVWKLWDEIKSEFLHIEFGFGNGLGVLFTGKDVDQNTTNFFLDNFNELNKVFFRLGSTLYNELEKNTLTKELSNHVESILVYKKQLEDKETQISEYDKNIVEYRKQLQDKETQISEYDKSVVEYRKQLQDKETQISEYDKNIVEYKKQLEELEKIMDLLYSKQGVINATNLQLKSLEQQLFEINSSKAWKVGMAFRKARLCLIPVNSTRENLLRKLLKKPKNKLITIPDSKKKNESAQYEFTIDNNFKKVGRKNYLEKPRVAPHSDSVDIIICVHNALDDVRTCLESVKLYTNPPYQLILVNDGSNPETSDYLELYAKENSATLIVNRVALGYTSAANQGMRKSMSPYFILLNSDTIVSPEWLDRLFAVMISRSEVGLVGPLSNTASWQSIPQIEENGDWASNTLASIEEMNEMANSIAESSGMIWPVVPLLNGFCMLIRRKVIDEIGLFDDTNFGEGYGEEDDFVLRARSKGWIAVVADDVYIYHSQSKSYSTEKRKRLSEQNFKRLIGKHGDDVIFSAVEILSKSRVFLGIRNRAAKITERSNLINNGFREFSGKSVLFVLPITNTGGGGNVVINEAKDMRKMGVDVQIFNLTQYKDSFKKNYPDLNIPQIYGTENDLRESCKQFDAVIATANYSVPWFQPLEEESQIILGYYAQGFEPLMYENGSPDFERAKLSYSLIPRMKCFSKTDWVKNNVYENTGVICKNIGISIDIDLFRPLEMILPGRMPINIVAMIRGNSPYRSPDLTISVLRHIKKIYKEKVNIFLYGAEDVTRVVNPALFDFEYAQFGRLKQHEVCSLFSNSDIFVDFSSHQAMGLSALEAMACGCAVVVPENGGAKEFVYNGRNGLIADTNSEKSCIESLCLLVENNDLRKNIQIKACLDVCEYYTEKAAYNILQYLFSD